MVRRWSSAEGKSYNSEMTCSLCDARKAKRHCPALRQEICSPCCGESREETLDCPLDCVFLGESRERERRPGLDPEQFPYKEIQITEKFLYDHEELLTAAGNIVMTAAFQVPGVVDRDVREALDALARTYKTLESGVYYETLPQSPVAQAVAAAIQRGIQEFRQEETRRTGVTRTRDVDVLGILVFLFRMALDEDNGRRYCKRFLHSLYDHFAPDQPAGARSSLVVPG
jgi:hypothetical protein